MRSLKIMVLSLVAATGVANAAITSTITAASDYNRRGISQNAKRPVLQASLDMERESGVYLGAFISSISFDGQKQGTEYYRLERDIYAGFKIKASETISLDFGGKYYTYNSNVLNHGEVYGSLTYKSLLKASAYYSPNFVKGDNPALSKPVYGVAVDGALALPANFSLLGHVGYNAGEYWTDYGNKSAYLDCSIGAGYKMGKVDWALQYIDTNTTTTKGNRVLADEMNNSSRIVLSATTKLPW